jgi:N-dimethylarginine dimethylaminohydrolase
MPQLYGVNSAYGDLKTALMHRPGVELGMVKPHTLAEFHFDEPVEQAAFVAEYAVMVALLQAHGVETLMLTDLLADDDDALGFIPHRPNMTYTRDLAVVFASGAVLMGPHLKGRWGDQRMVGRALRKLGIPILGAIEQPGFLEGGGVTLIGEDTIVASLCDRANEAGTRALQRLVLGREARYFLEVPLPFGEIHIDGAFMVVDADLCLVYEPVFEVFPCMLYEAGLSEPRHVMFLEFLEQRGIKRIPITAEEWKAGHLNVVVTQRGKQAVGFAGAQRIKTELGKHGWHLDTFSSDVLFLGNGGAHCMTCPLLVP